MVLSDGGVSDGQTDCGMRNNSVRYMVFIKNMLNNFEVCHH